MAEDCDPIVAFRSAIAKRVSMNRFQRLSILIGLVLGSVSVAYPPWTVSLSLPTITFNKRPAGYHFILNPPPTDDLKYATTIFSELSVFLESPLDPGDAKTFADYLSYRIDAKRLFVHLVILLMGTIALVWAGASHRSTSLGPQNN